MERRGQRPCEADSTSAGRAAFFFVRGTQGETPTMAWGVSDEEHGQGQASRREEDTPSRSSAASAAQGQRESVGMDTSVKKHASGRMDLYNQSRVCNLPTHSNTWSLQLTHHDSCVPSRNFRPPNGRGQWAAQWLSWIHFACLPSSPRVEQMADCSCQIISRRRSRRAACHPEKSVVLLPLSLLEMLITSRS